MDRSFGSAYFEKIATNDTNWSRRSCQGVPAVIVRMRG
jgi:hypothetical protein